MNIILLRTRDARTEDRWVLRDRRAAHVRAVLGAEVGATVRVGLEDGPLGEATVCRVSDLELELACRWDREAPPPWIDLALGIPRPKQLKKLLPQLAALGLRSLTFLRTWRVQRPYLDSPLLRPDGHEALLEEGLMQAGRTWWPRVRTVERFEDFCRERERATLAGARIVADPRADVDLSARPAGAIQRPVELVVGPEGGLLPYEVERLTACGFTATRFGSSTLRTDTACLILIGQLDLHTRMPVLD